MGARTGAECALRARRRPQQAERQDHGGDQANPVSERPLRGTPCIRPQTEAAGMTEPLVSICKAAESFWGPGCMPHAASLIDGHTVVRTPPNEIPVGRILAQQR